MGKSGFDKIESFSGGKNSATNWLTQDFSLPDDYPDQLMTFLHLNFNLSEPTIVSIIKNGTSYPLNNNETIVGVAFRSLPIEKGDVYNIQCDVTQTELQFTLSLEQ